MTEPSSPRPFATSRYGAAGDHVEWNNAIEEYHWDRLENAHRLALELGVGGSGGYGAWYRLIEAEAITRERSEVRRLTEWLELETIPDAVDAAALAPEIVAACDAVVQRFGWKHGPAVRVAVLAAESDAPWAIGRFGYMADKYPYDKICLPLRGLHDVATLVGHEYAHVMVLNAAEGKAPIWLDEAIAMLTERDLDPMARRAFADGDADWLEPDALDRAFQAERRNGENSRRVYLAYQQAAWIGRYLASCCSDARIGALLHGFANNSFWTEAKMRLTGQHPADEALREVFGMSEREAFANALEFLR